MTTNGTALETELTREELLGVLEGERKRILQERARLDIRHRIQTRLKGDKAIFDEIEANLIRCELALEELAAIEKEWSG